MGEWRKRQVRGFGFVKEAWASSYLLGSSWPHMSLETLPSAFLAPLNLNLGQVEEQLCNLRINESCMSRGECLPSQRSNCTRWEVRPQSAHAA